MIVCQAVCVALGLWIHSRYVTSSAEWAGRKNRWLELENSIPNLQAHRFETQEDESSLASEQKTNAASSKIDDIEVVAESAVLLIDKADQTVVQASQTGQFKVGQKVQWVPLVFADDFAGTSGYRSSGPLRGFLRADGVELLAIGLPVGDRIAVVHNSATDVKPDTSVIMQSLPLASGVTFMWLVGMHSIAVYLILSRMKDKVHRVLAYVVLY